MARAFLSLILVAGLCLVTAVQKTPSEPKKLGTFHCRLYDKNCDFFVNLKEAVNFETNQLNSSNPKIFRFERPHLVGFSENGTKAEEKYDIKIIPIQVGRSTLVMTSPDGTKTEIADVVITRPYRGIDIAFDVFLWVYVGLVSFVMGAVIHKDLIHEFLTAGRQKEVGLTFACQYILMPLLAYGMTKVFAVKPLQSLTLFIYGCCPSSFEATKWSEVFKGDVDLNKFSSLVSTFFAVVMMPAWLYTFGASLMDAADYRLPITGLALNFTVLIGPAIFGFILASCFPDLRFFANIANKLIHSLITIAIFLTLILCSRLYAFRLGNPLFILIGPMIAFLGYIIGAALAWLFGLPCNKIKSVSLHTGFQNIVFAFLIVNWNIPSPEVDYILVCLVPLFLQTSLPIKIIFLVQKIKGCVRRRKQSRNKPTKVEVDAEQPEQQPIYGNRE